MSHTSATQACLLQWRPVLNFFDISAAEVLNKIGTAHVQRMLTGLLRQWILGKRKIKESRLVYMASLVCLFQVGFSHLILPFDLWILILCKHAELSTSRTVPAVPMYRTLVHEQLCIMCMQCSE